MHLERIEAENAARTEYLAERVVSMELEVDLCGGPTTRAGYAKACAFHHWSSLLRAADPTHPVLDENRPV